LGCEEIQPKGLDSWYINRETVENEHPVVRGRIEVEDGFVLAQDSCQDDLGTRLDELVKMVLDMGLHLDAGATQIILGTAVFLIESNQYLILRGVYWKKRKH